jgi:ABC-type Mn2+/Zn2+ transport system ATPase subunit
MGSEVISGIQDKANREAPATRVHAESLDVGYSREIIVPHIDFDVSAGEALALIGTNGSGKSTLLKTIVGLLAPLGGRLSVMGRVPGASPRSTAYLGQFHHSGFILPLRVLDVVRMGRFPHRGLWRPLRLSDERIVLSSMQRMGIETMAESPLRSLSGGQQQRTYLAQVLAHEADLLVLDEPTSGLDAGGRELFLRAMDEELLRGASLIISTHDIHEEAALCRQVMLLARKVIALGPPQEVLTPKALLEAFGVVVSEGQRLQLLDQHQNETDGPDDGVRR